MPIHNHGSNEKNTSFISTFFKLHSIQITVQKKTFTKYTKMTPKFDDVRQRQRTAWSNHNCSVKDAYATNSCAKISQNPHKQANFPAKTASTSSFAILHSPA